MDNNQQKRSPKEWDQGSQKNMDKIIPIIEGKQSPTTDISQCLFFLVYNLINPKITTCGPDADDWASPWLRIMFWRLGWWWWKSLLYLWKEGWNKLIDQKGSWDWPCIFQGPFFFLVCIKSNYISQPLWQLGRGHIIEFWPVRCGPSRGMLLLGLLPTMCPQPSALCLFLTC